MILTEEEAVKRQCCGPEGCGSAPLVNYHPDTGVVKVPGQVRYCIASQCMAWRKNVAIAYSDPTDPFSVGTAVTKGYCGLAGG